MNRLTSATVSLNPTPLVSTFSFNAIGNLISKSDVGTYSYPAPGQPRPHGVTSISGGVINTTFTYDAKGNMTSGNGLTIAYTAFNKPATITRGTTSIAFDHDPEHQRYAQTGANGITLYLAGGGVMAERFAGSGGIVQWNNLIAGGQLIGVHVERSDETTATRYFHADHLGSISVITDESAVVLERLSYDAWGRRRHPDGSADPAGAISSEATRGFTGHEQLDAVGLIHMNGRVYDPLLARFGTPDPMTEDPFSTQGWNRYSYVGNSPLNFTDPSGYCFMGCFWKPIFKAIGNFLRKSWGAIVQIAAAVLCAPVGLSSVCAAVAAAAVTGITSGNLGLALRAGLISMVTSMAMEGLASAMTGITAGGGFGGNLASGSDSWGPMMRLNGPIQPEYVWKEGGFSLSGTDAASSGLSIPTLGSAASLPGAGASFGQSLLLQGIGAAAASSLNSLWQQQEIRASNYLQQAAHLGPCAGRGGMCGIGGGGGLPSGAARSGTGSKGVPNAAPAARATTDIVATPNGLVNVRPTLDRIDAGVKFPHRNDGSVFRNREGLLPVRPQGYYREFVHPTPGVSGPGGHRIIQGRGGELYYSRDHYQTFIPLN